MHNDLSNELLDRRVKGRDVFKELWKFICEEIDKLGDVEYESGREWLIKELHRRLPLPTPVDSPTGLSTSQITNLLKTPIPATWRKHAGRTVGEVLKIDRQYLEWICESDHLKDMIRKLLKSGYGEPEDDDQDGL